jgi:BCD family chlorophyll transporter-like MFS transporter
VLTTSTLNRIMVVELALPAMLPGFLVALHHAVQMLRPRFGHGSDVGGRTTGWIVGGMLVLAAGGVTASLGTAVAATHLAAGIAVCLLGFLAIGLGAGAAGTSLLVTLAKHVAPQRKAAAATIVWIMMIAGFAVTAATAGHFLDPYTPLRLVQVTAVVALVAVVVTLLAVYRVEPRAAAAASELPTRGHADFRAALQAGLGRSRGAAVHRVRVHFHAGLQRPGPHPRTFRRHRVCHDAGAVHAAGGCAARWRAARHAGGGGQQPG